MIHAATPFLCIVICAAAIPPSGNGSSAPTDVETWYAAERAAARAYPDIGGYALTYRIEYHNQPPADPSRSDPPAEPEEDEPSVARCTLWQDGPRQWRYNKSYRADGRDEYADIALNGDLSWALTPRQLTIVDQKAGAPPYRDFGSQEGSFRLDLSLMFHAGGYLQSGSVAPPEMTVSGTAWAVEATNVNGMTVLVSGRWDSEMSRGFTETARYTAFEAHPSQVGTAWDFSDWAFDPVLRRWVARRVECYRPDGALDRVLLFDRAEPETPQRLRTLIDIPSVHGDDPARGPLTVTSIYDYRPGVLTATVQEREGVVTTHLGSEESRRSARWMRYTGWVGAGALVTSLIAIRVLRGRTAQ